jgi:hypothetical protein
MRIFVLPFILSLESQTTTHLTIQAMGVVVWLPVVSKGDWCNMLPSVNILKTMAAIPDVR